jgi:dihydroflavonol-4-reductase
MQMKVMITGGTGFIGYHTTRALQDAGHEVVLLVRSLDKMRAMYGDSIEHYVVGDVADRDAVNRALDASDAAIHSAALVSTNARDAERVYQTNLQGTKLVIGGAAERGFKSIIHVSSVTALFNPECDVLDETSAVGTAQNAYGRSKVDSETFVRNLQDQGAAINITYPAGVIGPHAPSITEPHEGIITYLGKIVPVVPNGTQFVDVRDVALAHRMLLEGEHAPGRFPIAGHYIAWSDLIDRIQQLTGRKKTKFNLSAPVLLVLGRLLDLLRRVIPIDAPLSLEAAVYATSWVTVDNSKLERELNFRFRDLHDSLHDTISWLSEAGHVPAEAAGLLGAHYAKPAMAAEAAPSLETQN